MIKTIKRIQTMKKLFIIYVCWFAGVASAGTLFAQSKAITPILKIYKLSPSEQIEWLSQYTKITFRSDSIFIYDSNRELISQKPLSEVRVLVFDDIEDDKPIPTDIERNDAELTLKCYPNPATHSIRVSNYEPIQSIRVYSISGQPMPVGISIDGSTAQINVSSLMTGQYIILVNQTAVKLIKE